MEAAAAYERALELHRLTGEVPIAEVRILRSLAWLGLREEVTAVTVTGARKRMEEAAQVLETALAADPGSPGLRSNSPRPGTSWHRYSTDTSTRTGSPTRTTRTTTPGKSRTPGTSSSPMPGRSGRPR